MQVAMGVRARVLLIDALRTKYGFEAVTSLTPKVETRLRMGEQPMKDLEVQYVHKGSSIVLGVSRTYPENAINVTLGREDGSIDESLARRLEVMSNYMNKYSASIAQPEEEGIIVGIEIIEKCVALLDEHLESSHDLQINAVGEITTSIFQFGSMESALNDLNSTMSSSDPDASLPDGAIDDLEDDVVVNDKEPPVETAIYKCRKCRSTLFDSSDVLKHEEVRPSSSGCTSLFLRDDIIYEEDKGVLQLGDTGGGADTGNSGKLVCRKCQNRLGSWNWVGLTCSCKAWVCPAFQVTGSKVDKAATA